MTLFPKIAWFGLQPPSDVPLLAAWGCRAILTGKIDNQWVDVVWDRQQLWTPDDGPAVTFTDWLSRDFGRWLEGKCGQGWIDPKSSDTFRLDAHPFHAVASAKASFGYLYVGAWQAEERA